MLLWPIGGSGRENSAVMRVSRKKNSAALNSAVNGIVNETVKTAASVGLLIHT